MDIEEHHDSKAEMLEMFEKRKRVYTFTMFFVF